MIKMRAFAPFAFLLVLANVAKAGVLPRRTIGTEDTQSTTLELSPRDATPLSAEDFSAFTPFANFAAAAYCPSIEQWSCGCKYSPNIAETIFLGLIGV